MTISLQQRIMFGVLCIHVPECTHMSLALNSPACDGYTPRGSDIVTLELGFMRRRGWCRVSEGCCGSSLKVPERQKGKQVSGLCGHNPP